MGLIPQAKCSRCDRRYSGLRGRCPYCGARRSKKGKRVSAADNSTWKLVIGIVLLVVLIAAVVVLLITTLNADDAAKKTGDDDLITTPPSNEGVDSLDNEPIDSEPDDSEEQTGTNEPTEPEPTVQSISITYFGDPRTDITMKPAEVLPLWYKTVPEDVQETAVWSSSDENVFVVLQDGKITAIGQSGDEAVLTVTIGEVSAECVIRIS